MPDIIVETTKLSIKTDFKRKGLGPRAELVFHQITSDEVMWVIWLNGKSGACYAMDPRVRICEVRNNYASSSFFVTFNLDLQIYRVANDAVMILQKQMTRMRTPCKRSWDTSTSQFGVRRLSGHTQTI